MIIKSHISADVESDQGDYNLLVELQSVDLPQLAVAALLNFEVPRVVANSDSQENIPEEASTAPVP